MHRRLMACALFAGTAVLMPAADAAAQQTLNLSLGYFAVRGADARVEGDVINTNSTFLAFDVEDFNTSSIGRYRPRPRRGSTAAAGSARRAACRPAAPAPGC